MLSKKDLENLLHAPGISNQTRLLYCLALDEVKARPLADVRKIAVAAGWRGAKGANLSRYLGRAKGLAISTPDGWKLTDAGQRAVKKQALLPEAAPTTALTDALRKHVAKITNAETRAFIEEAIACAEHGLKRSAVVLSWVGAVAVLYDHVLAKKLAQFNAEAVKRNQKWKPASTADDLSRMEEFEFLQVIAAISVIGKNVKQELEGCLKLRNGCGHPNSLKVSDAKVAAHIETLTQNVFGVMS